MLNNNNRCFFFPVNLVNQFNRPFSCRRVQVGKRLIKQKNIHLVNHNACHRHSLFLPARKRARRITEYRLHFYRLRYSGYPLKHLFLRYHIIFQHKSDVFRNGQSDKLPVRVLKHRSDQFGQPENAKLFRILTGNRISSRNLSFIRKRHKTVDTVRQSRLSRTGRPHNQNLFPRINGQIDILDCRLFLGTIFKRKVFKFNYRFHESLLLSCLRFCQIFIFREMETASSHNFHTHGRMPAKRAFFQARKACCAGRRTSWRSIH